MFIFSDGFHWKRPHAVEKPGRPLRPWKPHHPHRPNVNGTDEPTKEANTGGNPVFGNENKPGSNNTHQGHGKPFKPWKNWVWGSKHNKTWNNGNGFPIFHWPPAPSHWQLPSASGDIDDNTLNPEGSGNDEPPQFQDGLDDVGFGKESLSTATEQKSDLRGKVFPTSLAIQYLITQ